MPWLLLTYLLVPVLHGGVTWRNASSYSTSPPSTWDEWVKWAEAQHSSAESEIPATIIVGRRQEEATFHPWTPPSVTTTSDYHPERDAELPRRMEHAHYRHLPTLTSFQDTAFFSQYGLNGSEYNASFFLVSDTLHELEHRLGWGREMYSLPSFSRIPLLSRRKSWQNSGTFHDLARKALRMTRNTPFEDLVKFTVARLINKHLLYFLEARRLLEVKERSDLDRRDRKVLRNIVSVLEDTVLFGDEPYHVVEDAIETLQSHFRSEIFVKLHEEDVWIDLQIREHFNVGNDRYGFRERST
ncbi:hypothetical protein ANCCAN_09659 [Ancylostoma caninum]|uniref:Peptidase M13 N-terminal domain-containing protein n=1 Tax=Ancylostoma caninum TaxID=29170 RepID=A0A368GMV2_ANCCA|nr:hypothetical protein ANCCAN_09659 [Ancylostoma caninum]